VSVITESVLAKFSYSEIFVCRFTGMRVVTRGGMKRWPRRRQNVNQSGWMRRILSLCSTQGNYHCTQRQSIAHTTHTRWILLNHASTPPLSFYRPDALPAAHPTASKHWRQTCTYNSNIIIVNKFVLHHKVVSSEAVCLWAEEEEKAWKKMTVFSLDLNTATESLLGTAFTIQRDSCHIEQSSSRTSVANCHRPLTYGQAACYWAEEEEKAWGKEECL